MPKKYGAVENYEKKLARVMERLGVEQYDYNWDQRECWVEFRYRGELYRFEHSIEKAKECGFNLQYGSDAFAQVVLSLEDLARMVERGIYDLSTWVAGLKFLPPAPEIPECFRFLGFDRIPKQEEVIERYRELAKKYHPDAGGTKEQFIRLQREMERAKAYYKTDNSQPLHA